MSFGIRGKKKLKFQTSEKEKHSRNRKVMGMFLVIVVVVATISIVVLAKEYNFFGGDVPEDNTFSPVPGSQLQETVTLLFAGVDTSGEAADFIFLISLDTTEHDFTVYAVSPKEKHDGKTLSDIYVESGSSYLSSATSFVTGLPIDRYMVVTEQNFKSFISAMGLPELEINTKIDYQSEDFSLNLLEGKQTLAGDKLYKYIRFVGLGGSDYELAEQAEIIGAIISQKLNETNTAKGEDLFATLINKCDSDVTIVDFTKYYSLLCEISSEPRNVESKLYKVERD